MNDRQVLVFVCNSSRMGAGRTAAQESSLAAPTVFRFDRYGVPDPITGHVKIRERSAESLGPSIASMLECLVDCPLPMELGEPQRWTTGIGSAVLLGALGVPQDELAGQLALILKNPAGVDRYRRLLSPILVRHRSLVRFAMHHGVDVATIGELRFRLVSR